MFKVAYGWHALRIKRELDGIELPAIVFGRNYVAQVAGSER